MTWWLLFSSLFSFLTSSNKRWLCRAKKLFHHKNKISDHSSQQIVFFLTVTICMSVFFTRKRFCIIFFGFSCFVLWNSLRDIILQACASKDILTVSFPSPLCFLLISLFLYFSKYYFGLTAIVISLALSILSIW